MVRDRRTAKRTAQRAVVTAMTAGGDDAELVGFFDAVEDATPREYEDYYWQERKPSSLMHAEDLIRMRGLLVTQAAELETGLRELLPLLETILAKSPDASSGKTLPTRRITGLGVALDEVRRRIAKAGDAGLLPNHEAIEAQLREVDEVRDIRNQAAHAPIRTDYVHDGVDWQPIMSWYGDDADADDADADGRDLVSQLARLKHRTVMLASVYWQLFALAESPDSDIAP
jgi:hypothetical protein